MWGYCLRFFKIENSIWPSNKCGKRGCLVRWWPLSRPILNNNVFCLSQFGVGHTEKNIQAQRSIPFGSFRNFRVASHRRSFAQQNNLWRTTRQNSHQPPCALYARASPTCTTKKHNLMRINCDVFVTLIVVLRKFAWIAVFTFGSALPQRGTIANICIDTEKGKVFGSSTGISWPNLDFIIYHHLTASHGRKVLKLKWSSVRNGVQGLPFARWIVDEQIEMRKRTKNPRGMSFIYNFRVCCRICSSVILDARLTTLQT